VSGELPEVTISVSVEIAFDGKSFVRTAATAPAFNYLRQIEGGNEGLVDQNSASWNQVQEWLSRLDAVRRAA
jgi:hypothetical protein